MKDFIKTNKYLLVALLLGCSIIPFGYWTEIGVGFVAVTNSLIGLSAAFTAWWAYKTFAFKERITEYKNIYEGLKNAESVYIKRYGSQYSLISSLIAASAHNNEVREDYIEQLGQIEREHKIAEDFLNDLYFSPFVSNNFKAKLLLLIQVQTFNNASEVQKAFFKIKTLHKEEFVIKT